MFHPNGIGTNDASDRLLSAYPLFTSGNVWYVDYANGVDAVSPQGLSQEYPLKTIEQAQTNATAGDIVVFLETHQETRSATLDLSKALTYVGCGTTSGKPSVVFTNNVSGDPMFTMSAAVELRNIMLGEDGAAATDEKLTGASGLRMVGCRVEVGDNDPTANTAGIEFGAASDVQIIDSILASTGTDPTAPPGKLLVVTGVQTRMLLQRCTLSAGITGFAGTLGFAGYLNAANVGLVMEDLTLQGADIYVAPASTGRYNVASSAGSSRVVW